MHKTLCYKEKGSFRAAELRKSELPVAVTKRSGEGGENGRPEKTVGHPLPHHAPPHPRAQHGRGGTAPPTATAHRPRAPHLDGRTDPPTGHVTSGERQRPAAPRPRRERHPRRGVPPGSRR
eukprot:scaffold3691_cov67-Phaeocystis_antarctica.AAC.1